MIYVRNNVKKVYSLKRAPLQTFKRGSVKRTSLIQDMVGMAHELEMVRDSIRFMIDRCGGDLIVPHWATYNFHEFASMTAKEIVEALDLEVEYLRQAWDNYQKGVIEVAPQIKQLYTTKQLEMPEVPVDLVAELRMAQRGIPSAHLVDFQKGLCIPGTENDEDELDESALELEGDDEEEMEVTNLKVVE